MGRRAFDRISARIDVKFLLGDKVYAGTVSNLSENGLLILVQFNSPVHLREDFEVLIIISKKRIMIPVKIRRLADQYNNCCPIAVEVLNPPREYLEFVGRHKCKYEYLSLYTQQILEKSY